MSDRKEWHVRFASHSFAEERLASARRAHEEHPTREFSP
jgi:hypothetical protein